MEYAVRGPIVIRAAEIEKELMQVRRSIAAFQSGPCNANHFRVRCRYNVSGKAIDLVAFQPRVKG